MTSLIHTIVVLNLRRARKFANAVIHALASSKVAVSLLILLAVVISAATILETKQGRPYSQWFVYHSSWFVGLLGLLGASVFCAAYVRFPWKRHQAGFVITHAGLLVLLSGSAITSWHGIEGQIVLMEGEKTDQFTLSQRSQITAHWTDRPNDRPYVFTFDSGPVNWKSGTNLDIGSVDGMSARVLHYYQCSQPVENWVADTSGHGGPLMRFQLAGPQGGHAETLALQTTQPVAGMLADQDYGDEVFVGPIAIRLQRATSDTMLADFLSPPSKELGEKGVLTIYYKDIVQHVSVDQHVGQAIKIGNTGARVELVQYLSNAKLDAAGKFQPIDETVRNPLVELKINLPGEDQPFRQVAFAKSPLLNFDGVYERECPVKFAYQHPKFTPATAIEFMQARDGKLYGRTIAGGQCESIGAVTTDSRLKLHGGFVFTVNEFIPHARREISFKPAVKNLDDDQSRESAATEVEISIAGQTKTLWLKRNSPQLESVTIDIAGRPLCTRFTTGQASLGFSLELVDFKREMNPGQVGNAAFSSLVRVVDKDHRVDHKQLIAMNHPLSHNGYRLYQSSFREAGHGKEASIFTVAYDPGRPLKYTGCLMICVGITTMFYMRAYSFEPRLRGESSQRDDASPFEPTFRISA